MAQNLLYYYDTGSESFLAKCKNILAIYIPSHHYLRPLYIIFIDITFKSIAVNNQNILIANSKRCKSPLSVIRILLFQKLRGEQQYVQKKREILYSTHTHTHV